MARKPRYLLECACCGREVRLSASRYLELRRSGELPICQTGCDSYAKSTMAKEYREGINIPGASGMKLQRTPGKSLKQAKIRYSIADRAKRIPNGPAF
jgi:hypothetical protein